MDATGKIWILYNAAVRKQTKALTVVEMQKLLLSLKIKNVEDYFLWTPGWNEWQPLIPFIESDQKYFVLTNIPKPPKRPRKKKEEAKAEAQAPNLLVDDPTSVVQTAATELFDDDQTAAMFHDVNTDGDFTTVDTKSRNPNSVDYGYYFNDFRAEDIDLNAPVPFDDVTQHGAGGAERRTTTRHDFKLEVILITKGGKTFRSHSRNISLGGTMLEDPVPKEFLNSEFDLIIINKFENDRNKGRLHFRAKIVGDIRNPKRLTFKEANQFMLNKLEKLLESYIAQQEALKKSTG